jgi:hypothetical protein
MAWRTSAAGRTGTPWGTLSQFPRTYTEQAPAR